MQIKAATIGPPVAGQNILWNQGHMIFEPRARIGKKRVKDGAHGQDGRACIDGASIRRQGAHLATGGGLAFQNQHLAAGIACDSGQPKGCGEARNARADNDDSAG